MRPIRTLVPLALGLVALAVAGCQSRPDQPTPPAPTPIEHAAPPTTAPAHQTPPPSRPPATNPKPKPAPDPETVVGLWPVRTLEQARMLQASADAGHQPWLLSPELVATSYGAAELGLYQPVARRVGANAYEVGATGSEWVAKLDLAQPVRQGAAGVWVITRSRELLGLAQSCILNEQLTKPRPLEAAMSDVDDFLAEIHPRLVAELQALHNGDPQPRLAMWSTKDPVTLFGAAMSGRGWDKVSGIFRSIASRWSDCTDQRVEMLAAGVSGDLAYTVELEHTSVSLDGVPVEPYTLRVTQVYRHEDGEWKVVHRHGDQISIDQRQSLPGEAS